MSAKSPSLSDHNSYHSFRWKWPSRRKEASLVGNLNTCTFLSVECFVHTSQSTVCNIKDITQGGDLIVSTVPTVPTILSGPFWRDMAPYSPLSRYQGRMQQLLGQSDAIALNHPKVPTVLPNHCFFSQCKHQEWNGQYYMLRNQRDPEGALERMLS
jgi:hypothetical protein